MWTHLRDCHVVRFPLCGSSPALRAFPYSFLIGVIPLLLTECALLLHYQLLTCVHRPSIPLSLPAILHRSYTLHCGAPPPPLLASVPLMVRYEGELPLK